MNETLIKFLPNCMSCGTQLNKKHEIKPGLYKCPSCGTEYYFKDQYSELTISKLANADRTRMSFQFDEAYDEYDMIVKSEPNLIEAHWGLFLSTYGIVHILDTMENKHVITMNRYLDDPVKKNPHLLKVLELSENAEIKKHYLEESNYIEQIRSTIFEHMKKQDKYDIFICYKSTIETEHGVQPTKDSKQAAAIYKHLQEIGYKNVFFAEETLKGKPGANWEAAIYTALSSAKIMILLCSNESFIKSPWVKNEWSRFIKQMEFDSTKIILPVKIGSFNLNYLPQKIKPYQAIDLESLDFKDELTKFVQKYATTRLGESLKKKKISVIEERKIIDRQPVEIVTRKIGGQSVSNYKINPSLEVKIANAELYFMSRKKFSQALKVYDEVLIEDPKVTGAYWGKIRCMLGVQELEQYPVAKSLSHTFPIFQQLMEVITHEEVNTYLLNYETALFNKLTRIGLMDVELFDFILGWKNAEEQEVFSERLFDLFSKELYNIPKLDQCLLTVLDCATKTLPESKTKTFVNRYTKIAELLLKKQQFQYVKQLSEIVLKLDAYSQRMNELVFMLKYKINDISDFASCIKDTQFVPDLEKLMQTGYTKRKLFDAIYDASLKFLVRKTTLSIELFDIFAAYIPDTYNEYLQESTLAYCNLLIQQSKFEEADRYLKQIISDFPTHTEAHFIRVKVTLKMKNFFEILLFYKKDLMMIPDFENAVNSSTDGAHLREYLFFHEKLHVKDKAYKDQKKENTKLKKDLISFYNELDKCSVIGSSKDFVNNTLKKTLLSVNKMIDHRNEARKVILKKTGIAVLVMIVSLFAMNYAYRIHAIPDFKASNIAGDSAKFIWNIILYVAIIPAIIIFLSLYKDFTDESGEEVNIIGKIITSYLTGLICVLILMGLVYVVVLILGGIMYILPPLLVTTAVGLLFAVPINIFIFKAREDLMDGPLRNHYKKVSIKWNLSISLGFLICLLFVILRY